MLLERQFGNQINIKDLTIEAPEKEKGFLFDPERDITQEDWGKMKGELARSRSGLASNKEYYMNLIGDIAILYPERTDELHIDNEIYNLAMRGLQENFLGDNYPSMYYALLHAKILKTLFPENHAQFFFSDPHWRQIANFLEDRVSSESRYDILTFHS